MEYWLFFSIFGADIFIPSLILFIFLQRLRNSILVVLKYNGIIKKVVINNKVLEGGFLKELDGKKINPITLKKEDIRYGSWRRWLILDFEHVDKTDRRLSDKEVEDYLNSETISLLLLFGKLKDLLFLLLYIILGIALIGAVVNGYLTYTHNLCELTLTNSTMNTIKISSEQALMNFYNMSVIPI